MIKVMVNVITYNRLSANMIFPSILRTSGYTKNVNQNSKKERFMKTKRILNTIAITLGIYLISKNIEFISLAFGRRITDFTLQNIELSKLFSSVISPMIFVLLGVLFISKPNIITPSINEKSKSHDDYNFKLIEEMIIRVAMIIIVTNNLVVIITQFISLHDYASVSEYINLIKSIIVVRGFLVLVGLLIYFYSKPISSKVFRMNKKMISESNSK